MANTKISALTAGAPAQSTDLLPIDRAGANYSLQVSDIVSEGIVGGGNSGGIQSPAVVASLVLTGQTVPDGSATAHNLFTVVTAGVYRVCGFAVPRTKNSGAWTVNVDVTWPSGTNFSASALQTLNMVTPAAPSSVNGEQMYLHVSDAITCGTATGTGSRDSGIFDVSWTVERIV